MQLLGGRPVDTPARARARAFVEGPWALVAVALVTVALRLPYLDSPLGSDESGFLVVARHWHEAGDQIYGPYWVDRPPLLIALFDLGDRLGGVTGLRVLGSVAAAVTVSCVGGCVRRLRGPLAGVVAGAVAAVLLLTPQLGTISVNGELLAAPFVAAGTWAAVVAVTTSSPRLRVLASLATGAAAAAAVLVKQNMIDVGVFALVLVVVAVRRGVLRPGLVPGLVAGALAGAAAVTALMLAVAGTSLGDTVYAMYGFRVDAAGVVTDAGPSAVAGLGRLLLFELGTLAPVAVVVLVVLMVRRRLGEAEPGVLPTAVATLVLTAYAVVSIVAGGAYWTHYLVQLVIPTALAAGLVVTPVRVRGVQRLLAAVVAVGLLSWTVGLFSTLPAGAQVAGEAIADVAEPDDTLVSLFGSNEIIETTGLESPYEYLWTLPSRTLDPDTADLEAVLLEDRPTWVVIRDDYVRGVLDTEGAGALVDADYRLVGTICERMVYLRVGVDWEPPVPPDDSCARPFVPWLR